MMNMEMKNKKRTLPFNIILLISLLMGTLGVQPVQAGSGVVKDPETMASFFDAFLSEQMAADAIVGASAAVVQDGELVFAKGYGYADLENKVPVKAEETLFFIGSDGKLFTWTAVMQLAEQGKLDLHADVNTYLDFELPAPFGKPITLHHLMTHTAGFEDDLNSLMAASEVDVLPLREHLLAHMPQQVFEPGTVSAYSNYGTALAGYIVERVSGMPFERYIETQILEPLGMDQSVVGNQVDSDRIAAYARGYKALEGGHRVVDFEWTAAVPCAPLRTTVTDLSRFVQAHLQDGCVDGACILKPETLQQMHASQFTHPGQVSGMTYGFLDTRINQQRILWHLGESPSFTTLVALIPEQNLGLIVTYNTPPTDDKAVLFGFMDAFYPVTAAPVQAQALPGWEERAKPFTGWYVPARSVETQPGKVIRLLQTAPVAIDQGSLTFSGWKFQEVSAGVFQEVQGDRILTLNEDTSGRRWLYVGPLAYVQVSWMESPGIYLVRLVFILLAFLSVWFLGLMKLLKKQMVIGKAALWLAGGFGVAALGLLGWFVQVMLIYAETYVYQQETIHLISGLSWLLLPWAAAGVLVTARAWQKRLWTLGWRLYYAVIVLAMGVTVWLFFSLNLM